MKSFSSCITQVLYKSFLALASYSFLYSWNSSGLSHHDNGMNLENLPIHPPQDHLFSEDYLNIPKNFSLDFLAFMLLTLALDGLVAIILQSIKKSKEDRGHGFQGLKSSFERPNWRREILRMVVVYAIFFCLFQAVIGGFNEIFCSSVCKTHSGLFKEAGSHRLLEEIEPISDDYEGPERISLSLGKVLSSLNIQAGHMVVTKDMRYAFATVLSTGALKVIDISNLAAPNVVKTLSLVARPNRPKFMYLSLDEKILFVSCFEYLEIVDITNPESANREAYFQDENYKNLMWFIKARIVSFGLSADSKTLFVGGLGLQTFDISDPGRPILLESQISMPASSIDAERYLLTIAVTSDRKTLWIANGTLACYDISDARNMRLITSFSDAQTSMKSIALSHDNKTAFGLGMIGTEKVQITKIDISNPASPTKTQSLVFAQTSFRPAYVLSLSQKDRYMFVVVEATVKVAGGRDVQENQIVVFDLIEKRAMSNDQSLLKTMSTVTTLSKENIFLASGQEKMIIVEFYKVFPNREIFGLADYPVRKIKTTEKSNDIVLSQDEKLMFLTSYQESSSTYLVGIYDFLNKTFPDLLSSFEIDWMGPGIVISRDVRRVALFKGEQISLWDVSDLTIPFHYSEYDAEQDAEVREVAFWSDSNIVFFTTEAYQDERELKVMDFSDPESPEVLFELALAEGIGQPSKMAFSKDKALFFLIGPILTIYNSSDIHNLHEIGSTNITTEETEYVNFAQVSHDGKNCFVETVDQSSFHKLKVYDTSDLRNPKLAAELLLPIQVKRFPVITPMVSEDSKTLYILQKQDIMAIDVSNIRAPRIFGLLSIGDVSQEGITQIKLSGDGKTMYIVAKNGTIHSMSLQARQTLYLNREEFYIGQQYSDRPLVVKFNGGSEYTLVEESQYKIAKMGIFEVKVQATTEVATPSLTFLPSWSNFDQIRQVLTIEPRKQSDLGYYTLFAAISHKVSASAFSFLDTENQTTRANAAISELILRNYLDRQQFMASEIGPLERFWLPNYFEEFEREQIYAILKDYYVVTCTTINILPSLKVETEASRLSISSPNANFVKISIQLQNTTHAKFLKKQDGLLSRVITNGKSHLIIEGSLKEVNTALGNITIDLEDLETCSAEMVVVDDMNPSITVNLSDIKNYFRINVAPHENLKKPVQKQIDMVPVSTGQYFTITLDSDTILDGNSDSLNYKLVSKSDKANDTIPSWLRFESLTLRGTAPEVLFDRGIEFTLVASNEFKKVEVPFRLHLKISSTFVAKLIMRYSPYILTILGLYIKANKIYNIFGKKNYRHNKDFYVEIGKEITNEVIFPIAFIQEELKESEIIWKRIPKNKINNLIAKEDILKLIRETVNSYTPQEVKQKLKVYFYGVDSRKKVINQLLINKLIYLQLNLKEEKATKGAFEKAKGKWPELIHWDSSSEYFKTDMEKLSELLAETEDSVVEESLLSKLKGRGVNLSLLSDALEAYAFDRHSINRLAISCNIRLKEKTEKDWLQRFFKLDIKTINQDSQLQVDYGISCKFENDSLAFAGVPCENFRKRTLIIQIATAKCRILKEIWIHEKSVSHVNWDTNTEEGHYEVF